MIFGRSEQQAVGTDPLEMKEISLSASSEDLKLLAAFILKQADEMEAAKSQNWHRHINSSLCDRLGCDVVVLKHPVP